MVDGISDKETNGRNGNRLIRELKKIGDVERSGIRMLETSRHRLRSKLKRFEVPHLSSGSDAMDVRMYDTHNPGFCYHCNGVIKPCNLSPKKKFIDLYDAVYTMIFTDGEVDPDKVLCLHVLAAHYAKSGSNQSSEIRPITPLVEKGKKENFGGIWNSILPCYVMDIERNVHDTKNFSDEMKRHKDSLVMEADEVIKDFECKYEKYIRENSDVGLAISTNHKRTKMIPNGIGKTTIIPPHVYSLLGAAQELKIKQAIAEESRRKKFRRSNASFKNVDDQSISFRLDDEEDAISRRLMTASSMRGSNDPRIDGVSKASVFQSLSRRSATSYNRMDSSTTTLKRASPRSNDVHSLSEDTRIDTQIVTIKSSDRTMGPVVSKSSSTKSPFRYFLGAHGPASPCSNSIMSDISGPFGEPRKILRPIFINCPVENIELRNKRYKTVPILVNNQMQALVHSVLDVLERVNPIKMQKIISTAKSPWEIRRMLIRPDIQLFIDTLAGQPLISSPNSYVVSIASIINEIDPRFENIIEKEIVATTLAVPPAPGLHRLIEEIRNNLFVDPEQIMGSKAQMKIEPFGRQKQKLLESNDFAEELNDRKDVFDLHNSCPHSDVQGTKTTCACCYAKWKESLPDTERSKVPDFSFVVNQQNEMNPETIRHESHTNPDIKENEDGQKVEDSEKEKKSPGDSSPLAGAGIIQSSEINRSQIPPQGLGTATNLGMTQSGQSNSSRSKKLLRKGAIPKGLRSIGLKRSEDRERASLYSVEQKSSRLGKNKSGSKLFEKSIRARTRLSRQKMNIDQINEAQSSYLLGESTSILSSTEYCESIIGTNRQKLCSKITLGDNEPSPKCQFKPWQASRDPSYLEPDRIILRRMTNPQRILVGQMCASLKTRKINMEGLVREKTPLAALITPVLSHEALRILTKGTRQAKNQKKEIMREKYDRSIIVSGELTGPVLAKGIIAMDLTRINNDATGPCEFSVKHVASGFRKKQF